MNLQVADVRFTPGSPGDHARGLLGYLELTLNGRIRVDGLTLRRTRSGQLEISFPRRRGGFRPLDDTARQEIQRQILEHLGFDRGAA